MEAAPRLDDRHRALLARLGDLEAVGQPIEGTQARVWPVRVAGRDLALKLLFHAAAHRREGAAYQALAPHLGCAMPPLWGSWDRPSPALLLGWIEPVASHSDLERHARAGAVLARLQRAPCPPDDLSVEDALARRLDHWSRRAEPHLPVELLRAARARIDPRAFAGWPRVWAHRDYEPRNWLGGAEGLVVLDYGQARPDLLGWDLVKLAAAVWPDRPDLEHAFRRELGPAPGSRELRPLVLLHGLQTATWGLLHRAEPFARHGLSILRRFLA